MHGLLRVLDFHDGVLRRIARFFAWLMLILVFVITFDVVTRKIGLQIPGFGSTKLQDLEWHFHAVIFVFWYGYGYLLNAHVRVDVLTAQLDLRRKAWLDLIGCFVFALPFSLIVARYGVEMAYSAWVIDEGPESATGLGNRWIVKGLFATGLVLLVLGVVSMMLRLALHLFAQHRIGPVPIPFKGPDEAVKPT